MLSETNKISVKKIVFFLTIFLLFSCTNKVITNDKITVSNNAKEEISNNVSKNENISQESIEDKNNTNIKFKDCWKDILKNSDYDEYFCLADDWIYYNLWNNLKKLFNADIDSLQKYSWDIITRWAYYDDTHVFFFPMNWEWKQTEMNVKKINKIEKSNYFHDENRYFFDFWVHAIIKLWIYRNNKDTIKYLQNDLIIINDKIFYKWKNQSELKIDADNIVINQEFSSFTSDNRLFFFNYYKLTELEWVDLVTFKKIEEAKYEDKNNVYKIIHWHYWFEIEIEAKK